jgi:hypothetical protein
VLGRTCKDIGPLEFGGCRFESLYDYYSQRRPRLGVEPDDAVVFVSFRGMRGDKPVAAKLLRLRVCWSTVSCADDPGVSARRPCHAERRSRAGERFGADFRRVAATRSGDAMAMLRA